MPSVLLERLAAHTSNAPTKPAVIEPAGQITSRADLLATAAHHADRLQHLGIAPGDLVMLHAPGAGAAFHAWDLATLMCGAVPASVPEYPAADQISALLDNLRPGCVIDTAPDELLAAATAHSEIPYHHPCPRTAPSGSANGALRRISAAARPPGACVIFTSGSTGQSRPVLLDERSLADGLDAWRSLWPGAARQATRTLASLPVSHIAQRIMGHYLLCLYGTTVHTTIPDRLAAAVITTRPQVLLTVPHTLTALAHAASTGNAEALRRALAEVALVVNGAAALPAATAEALAALSVPVAGAYGMTETTVPAFHHHPDDGSGELGEAVPGVRARLEEDGHLLLHTSYAARYVTTWPGTAPVTGPDGWIRTGDRALAGPDGGLRLAGRISSTIKTARSPDQPRTPRGAPERPAWRGRLLRARPRTSLRGGHRQHAHSQSLG